MIDPAFFCYYEGDKLEGILISHVDDFLYAGNEVFMNKVIRVIEQKYAISSHYEGDFEYVGLSLQSSCDGITMNQTTFNEKLETIKLGADKMKNNERILDDNEKRLYQQLLGRINWLSHQSRPDLAFDAFSASLASQSPTVQDVKLLNKVVSKVDNGLNNIFYPRLDETSLRIVVFGDASYANLKDKVSSGEGYLVFLADKRGNSCLLNWKSKKIKRVVHSTEAAECLALVDCNGDAHYIRSILEELLYKKPCKSIPILVCTDSIQLRKALISTHLVTEKLLRITIAEMKQILEDDDEKTSICWVRSENMLSDCLTKKGASSLRLCQALESGFIDIQSLLSEDREKLGASSS